MKRILFLSMFLLVGLVSYGQGDLKIGVSAGIPTGDIEEVSSFALGVDAAYLLEVGEGFTAGPMIGVSHFFGKTFDVPGFGEVEAEDITFLPIAASGRIGLGESFFLGADLGYALGISEGNDGGFYYRPKVGYNLGGLAVIASYSGVSMDGGSVPALNLGIEFGL